MTAQVGLERRLRAHLAVDSVKLHLIYSIPGYTYPNY